LANAISGLGNLSSVPTVSSSNSGIPQPTGGGLGGGGK
jgi:hypothetical protein